jgi:hypothetical protein
MRFCAASGDDAVTELPEEAASVMQFSGLGAGILP